MLFERIERKKICLAVKKKPPTLAVTGFSNLKFCETCTVISSLRRERDEESEGEFMDLGIITSQEAFTTVFAVELLIGSSCHAMNHFELLSSQLISS